MHDRRTATQTVAWDRRRGVGTAFDRWWPRVAAVAQLGIGAWTFLHPVWTRGPEAIAGQFWSVALMAGAPTAVFALRTIAERAGRLSGGG